MRRVFFTILISLCVYNVSSQEIKFAIGEWIPYTTSTDRGLATEIVFAACNAAGIKCSIVHTPWLRAEKLVETGDVFGTFPYALTDERKNVYRFSDPIFKSTNLIIYNTNNPRVNVNAINSINSFAKYKIGMTTGSDALAAPLRKNNAIVEMTETIDMSFKKLQSGRIDFIIEDYYVISHLLSKYNDQNILLVNKKILNLDREYCVMITKKETNTIDNLKLFNKGLQIIHNNGLYQSIIAKY